MIRKLVTVKQVVYSLYTAVHCSPLLYTAVHCCTLLSTAVHCCKLLYTLFNVVHSVHCWTLLSTAVQSASPPSVNLPLPTSPFTAVHSNASTPSLGVFTTHYCTRKAPHCTLHHVVYFTTYYCTPRTHNTSPHCTLHHTLHTLQGPNILQPICCEV